MTTSQCPAAALAANFDFTDPGVRRDPPAVYAELRKGPPCWSDSYGGHWVVTRYADIVRVLEDPGRFTSAKGVPFPPSGFPVPMLPNECDRPDHTYWRRLAAPFFTLRAIARLEDSIRSVTQERLATFIESGRADLARDLASHIPAYVIADMMGFPRSEAAWFAAITDRMLATSEHPETAAENAQVGGELVAYLSRHLEARRAERRSDLLSDLVHGQVDGRPLTPNELLGISFFFLIAGLETTVGGMTFLLWRLGLNPAQRDRVIEDRSLVRSTIEESLRIDSPVVHLSRVATEDVDLDGASIKAGDRVMIIYAAANLDEEAFPDASTFLVDRASNKHVAFSAGIHKCQGAEMARLEMRVVLEEVLNAIPDYALIDDAVTFRRVGGVHSLSSLPVTFTPSSAERFAAS